MSEYEILRLIWWALLGILLIGFAVMDGFDLGVAMLLPFVTKSDSERRIVLNTVGPVWEGNQVWLILGAGAIFAVGDALGAQEVGADGVGFGAERIGFSGEQGVIHGHQKLAKMRTFELQR